MFGGDGGPEIIVRGVFRALMCQSEYDFVLAGSSLIAQIVIGEEASKAGILAEGLMSRVSIIETNSFVTNKEDPKNMVRDRNDTSMVLALKALKEDPEIRAMVTAGSTGCALVGSCFHLGLEKGLLQPALASALPREGGGYTLLLDCGSNIDPKAKDLENYARLGSAMVRRSYGVETPRVGLLNVGKEKEKGTEVLKEAFGRIEKSAEENGFSFEGNIEGGDILTAGLDVVVCDGFTGNVIIKGFESVGLISAELAASSERFKVLLEPDDTGKPNGVLLNKSGKTETDGYHRQIDDPYNQAAGQQLASETAKDVPGSAKIRRFFDYNSQAGAIYLGTDKLIMKAHGAATADTILSCILQAINLVEGQS